MKIISTYILTKYIKYFIILLLSLQLFFVGIDFLQNYSSIPHSANLQFLYLVYNAFFALTLTLPLSLVFAWIVTLIILIKNNEFVAFLSVGAKPIYIYIPVLIFSILLLIILIIMQSTPLAYSYEQRTKIIEGKYFTSSYNDIFLKEGNNFIFFKRFFPVEQRAEDIHIFEVVNKDIVKRIIANKALFADGKWNIYDAKITFKPKDIKWDSSKIVNERKEIVTTLEGFKPSILESVYETKANFSIVDAVQALFLLKTQDIDTKSVRASLYYQAFVPFFVLPMILVVFVVSSINSRFFNLARFSTLTIFFTLALWGAFFMLHKFSKGGVLAPEVAILIPLFLWFILGYYMFKKRIINY